MGSREWYRPRAVHGSRPFNRAFGQLHNVRGNALTLARADERPRRSRLAFTAALTAILILAALTPAAHAANSVFVESKTVLGGSANVPVHIRITNDIPLTELRVPLEIRSVDGAFPYALSMSYAERLAGSVLSDISRRRHYPERDGAPCNPLDADGYFTYDSGIIKDTVEASPEAVMFFRQSTVSTLPPGSDGTGSMVLNLDIDVFTGSFVIDTTCIAPGTYFGFNQGVQVDFTPGIITVVATAPDTLHVEIDGNDDLGDGHSIPFATIQRAIDSVANFQTVILVGPGVYTGPVHYPMQQNLTIASSNGPFETVIVGDSSTSVVMMDAGDDVSEQVLDGFTVRDNGLQGATLNGSGITVKSPTIGSIYNCIIANNSTESGAAAGIEYQGAGGTIANCWIVKNRSTEIGFAVGGVYIAPTSNVTMVNNTIASNFSSASNGASGVFLDGIGTSAGRASILGGAWAAGALRPSVGAAVAVAQFDNNIIAFNTSGYGLRAATPADYPAAFHNCVYFSNTLTQAGIYDSPTLVLDDPVFRDTSAGDYHIACASSARDAGNASYFPTSIPWTDIDGQPRFGPGVPVIDIGADEFFDDNKMVEFETSDTVGCAPLTVQFTNMSDLCFNEGYRWDFGDGIIVDNFANPIHVYEDEGIYTVKFVAEGLYADSVIKTDLIRVIAPPAADFTGDTLSGCQTLTVSFEATTETQVDLFTWNFGDGDTAVGVTTQHTYDVPGVYPVRLYSTNFCGTDSVVKEDYIHVAAPIAANFSASPQIGCDQLEVKFIAAASTDVEEFAWDFGDAVFSAEFAALGDTVTHLYTQAGIYTVRLFASNACGTTTVVKEDLIAISDKPQVFIDSDHDPQNPGCNPYTVNFTFFPQDGIDSVKWEFGDNGQSTAFNPMHTYETGGRTYSVRLFAYGSCGADTALQNQYIHVILHPTASLSATPSVGCVGSVPVNLLATIAGDVDSTRWYFDDGTSAPGPAIAHTYASMGTYEPWLKMWHGCGIDSIGLGTTVTASTTPVAAFAATATEGYEPFEAHFTDQTTNTPTAWHWDFGDGDTSVVQNPVHSYGPGIHSVTLNASNPCGASEFSRGNYILVGGFAVAIDSTGADADTILYSAQVTAEVLAYDHNVNLSAELTGNPRRGTMNFIISPSSGMPPFTATVKAIPSADLSSGAFGVKVTATDPTRTSKIASRSLNFTGTPIIQISPPDSVRMDSTEIGLSSSKSIVIRNIAPAGSGLRLVVDPPTITGPAFRVVGNGGTISPQQQLLWGIEFTPLQKNSYTGTIHVLSDDPVAQQIEYIVRGRGIGNQTPPILSAALPDTMLETKIDDSIRVTFSKSMVQIAADTVLIVRSLGTGDTLLGQRRWVNTKILQFKPLGLFPADDTIGVTVRAVITDIDGNYFDGNGDQFEQFSPEDDYSFTFSTGPAVYPGDTDQDGKVNEGDVIPIGRFWHLEGLRRTHARPGFTAQPALSWDPRAATHADADGDGTIDELDICPIADYFDREVVLPKATIESWMAEAASWSGGIVDAMLSALDQCDKASASGKAVLGQFLRSLAHADPVPKEFSLSQNYPNPFNPTTVIEYTLGEDSDVRLEIYNIQGQLVRTLETGRRTSGRHFKVWDGRNSEGHDVASGVYFYRLITPNFQYARKMVLVR